MPSYFRWSACARSCALESTRLCAALETARNRAKAVAKKVRSTELIGSAGHQPSVRVSTIAEIARQGGEDARGVRRSEGVAGAVERDEADATLEDQRVTPRHNHVTKSHPADGVRGQPRFHPDLDRCAAAAER